MPSHRRGQGAAPSPRISPRAPARRRPGAAGPAALRPLAFALRLAAAGAAVSPLAWAAHAQAQEAPAQRRYDIPAGPLTAVLNRFSEEAGVFLTGAGELTQGKSSAGLRGRYGVAEGFAAILRGQGLQAVPGGGNSYTLRPAPVQPAGGVAQLQAVSVSASAGDDGTLQHLSAPVDSGALGSRSQLETPFSTAVVTQSDIREHRPGKLGDLFVTDASVSDNSGAYDGWASYLTVRGLPLDWQNSFRIDGKPFLSYAVTLPYEHFEQVDLLKGASGFMYGFGSPGGLVNFVTKKPTDQPVREIDAGYASDSLARGHVDLGGRAGADDRFGYRLNATHEEGARPNDGSLYRDSVSLALDARLSERLTWDFQGLYQDSTATRQAPSINTGQMAGGSLPSVPRGDGSDLTGEGNYVDNAFRHYATGLAYRLSPDWKASASFSHSSTRTRRNESVFMLADGLGNYDDYRSDYGESYQFNQWQAMLEGKASTGALRHRIVLGASWQKQRNYYGANSVYEQVGTGSVHRANDNTYYSRGAFGSLDLYRAADIAQKALFASDTVELGGGWSVLGGLRYTAYRQNGYDPGGARNAVYDKDVVTPTAALMYKIDPQTMAYASYVESLEPGSTVGNLYANYGETLNPLKSKQYEVGVKTERESWAASAALFRIERGAEYADAANVLVQDGESVYQGLELGASKRLGADWDLGATLMLLDSEYRKGADYLGNRVAGAPRFVAAGRLVYRVPQLPGLSLRASAKYTGSTWLRPGNDVKVGGYAIVDLAATYETRVAGYDTTFRLAVDNVADKRYWEFQYSDYVKLGEPRSVSLTASVRF